MQFAMRIQIDDPDFMDDPERLAKMIRTVADEVENYDTSGVIPEGGACSSSPDGTEPHVVSDGPECEECGAHAIVGDWTINE